jgi:hypothetical protein
MLGDAVHLSEDEPPPSEQVPELTSQDEAENRRNAEQAI